MINWQRIDELRSEIGDEDFKDVLGIFLEEIDETTTRLEGGEVTDLEGEMHAMKGSALNVGLADLAILCEKAERMAREGDDRAIDVKQIILCARQSRDQLEGRLPKPAA